ncbi:hypothetical protein MNV49_001281 [Pseudohyphozyma bogoriensis]|nr:hypothetical protein MNV49_001281 [Pseudohyphozyma bogoriensis]
MPQDTELLELGDYSDPEEDALLLPGSTTPAPPPPTALLAGPRSPLAIAWVLSSATSAFIISRVANRSTHISYALEPAKFLLVAGVLAVQRYTWRWRRREEGDDERGPHWCTEEIVLAILLVVSGSLMIEEARVEHVVVWSAVEAALLLSGVTYAILYTLNGFHNFRSRHETPDTFLFIAYPIFSALALVTLFNLLHNLSDSFLLPSIALSARNLLILAIGGLVGQAGARLALLKAVLPVVYISSLAATYPPSTRTSSDDSNKPKLKYLIPLPITPIVVATLLSVAHVVLPSCSSTSNTWFCTRQPTSTLDIVIAHYDRSLSSVTSHLSYILSTPLVQSSQHRIFFYEKSETPLDDLWAGLPLVRGRDIVTHLPNWGREGATYLRHIIAMHNRTTTPGATDGLADLTMFLQGHLDWDSIAKQRIDSIVPHRTGFISLGPYRSSVCGFDPNQGFLFPGMRDVWRLFRGEECDPEVTATATWAGQFVVSRERILENGIHAYEEISKMIEAPDDDPIHNVWATLPSATASSVAGP